MDGTLGSQTARMLDGSGVADHERRGAPAEIRARRGGRVAGSRARDRRPREPRGARRLRATRERWRRSGCGSGSSTRSASRPRICRRFAELGVACSVQFSHAPSDRDLAERFWPDKLEGTYAFRSLIESGALVANGSDAPDRGARSAGRHPRRRPADDRRAARLAPRAGGDARAGARRDHRHARRGSPATSGRAASSCPATSPTSSCCPATRSSARRGARDGRGGRDDGRRPLGAQPAALGLTRKPR